MTSEVTKEATTKADGVRTYTATSTYNGVTTTETKTESIPKLDDGGGNINTGFLSRLLDSISNFFHKLFGWLPFC